MKRWSLVAVVVVAALSIVAGAGARSHEEINGTLADITTSDPNFSTLVSLAKAAGFADELADPKTYLTVFAPTNAAFRRLEKAAPGVTKALTDPKNRALLVAVLKHHLSRQHLSSITLGETGQKKGKIPTLLPGGDGKLAVGKKPFTFTLTDSAGLNTATATELDVAADNGGIQVIDRVLVPKSVAAALKKAGLLT